MIRCPITKVRNFRAKDVMMKKALIALTIFILVGSIHSKASAEVELTSLVKEIRPAVVTVIAYDINHRVSNLGTGFFVDKSGLLITNFHVLEGRYAAEVRTATGNTYNVKFVIAENKSSDLIKVLVDIPRRQFQWIKVNAEMPAIAERVVVVGSPMGLEQTVSEGIVSSIREIPNIGNFFQISAPISPGSSGSPVLNMSGEVIGVATFQFLQGQNLNFAVAGKSLLDLEPDKPRQTISEWTYYRSMQKPRLAEELCRKGFTFSINGQDQKAIEFFKEATEKDPKDTMAWYGLGYCYAGLNNSQDAIKAYRQAIKMNPADETAYFNLGNYYNKLGQFDDAIEAYQNVVQLNPKFEPAYFNLGMIFVQLNRFDEGRTAFEKVIKLNPEAAPAYFNIGLIYNQLGQYQAAIEANEQVIRINPEFAPAHFNLGVLYGKLNKPDDEIGAYKQAIRFDPDFAPAHFKIGGAYLQMGDKAAALEEYKILKNLDKEMANELFNAIYQ